MKITPSRAAVFILVSLMLVVLAAFISGNNGQVAEQAVNLQQEADLMEKFKTERQQLRAMQKAQLNDIIHDADAEAETAEMARRQLLEICRSEEQELTIEGVLAVRGYEDPVATVHSGSVNILIRSEGLTQQESSVILDLVCRETGAISGDIKIIPIN